MSYVEAATWDSEVLALDTGDVMLVHFPTEKGINRCKALTAEYKRELTEESCTLPVPDHG